MTCRAALVLPAFLSAAACGWAGPEEQVLTLFFHAAGLQDQTALADLATVTFDPLTRGTVHGFVVESMTEDVSQGATISKQVHLRADVRTPEGRIEAQELVVTMQRDEPNGRWMVTAIRAA